MDKMKRKISTFHWAKLDALAQSASYENLYYRHVLQLYLQSSNISCYNKACEIAMFFSWQNKNELPVMPMHSD